MVEVKNKAAEVEKEHPVRKEEIRTERRGEDGKNKKGRGTLRTSAPDVRETPGRGDYLSFWRKGAVVSGFYRGCLHGKVRKRATVLSSQTFVKPRNGSTTTPVSERN